MNYRDSIRYIRVAAAQGDPFAQFELAMAYEYGNVLKQNLSRAAIWYQQAARRGHTQANFNLDLQSILAQHNTKNWVAILSRLRSRAKNGDPDAQNNLGLCYFFGRGVKQNYKEALRWYKMASLAGHSTARFNLGGLFYEGHGVRKNHQRAALWYSLAAQQRDELALIKLANMYQKGEGVRQNHKRAFVLYLCAYRKGSMRAMVHLGVMFANGHGVKRNSKVAFDLFQRSLNEPDTPDIKPNLSYAQTAFYWLGKLTEKGDRAEQGIRQALEWYKKGVRIGCNSCKAAVKRLRR